jgi:putative sterol carrier protein
VPEIASEEWLQELVRAGGSTPATPGVSGAVSFTVENSPAGKVGWTETIEDGVVVAAAAPASKGADIALIAKFPELVEMLEGGSNPAVMFMQGRLKLTGDMGMFMKMLPAMLTTEAASGRALLAAETDR